jgi:hypothetical protein
MRHRRVQKKSRENLKGNGGHEPNDHGQRRLPEQVGQTEKYPRIELIMKRARAHHAQKVAEKERRDNKLRRRQSGLGAARHEFANKAKQATLRAAVGVEAM